MVGIDIIEIDRIESAIKRTKSFFDKTFTQYEKDYYIKKGRHIQTLAGFFCVKEATVKALGVGFGKIGLLDIEVRHRESGEPYAELYNEAKKLSGNKNIEISISHSQNYATAVCIISENKY